MSMYHSEFGLKARVIMLKKGITITEVANQLGVTPSYVSDILRGVREGKPQRQKIVDILGMENEVQGCDSP